MSKINIANALLNGLPILNKDLYKKCDKTKYSLQLTRYEDRDKDATVYDEQTNYESILCLYYDKKCISSVVGRYHATNNSMEILSKTYPSFENKKFNLYLRTAFIYLMCFVRPTIQQIFSFSVNPISTYTMYKYYHATNQDLDEFVMENHLTPETFTVEDAKRFHEYYENKHRITEEKAEIELKEMLEDYSMEELGWETKEEAIDFIMSTMNIEAISLSMSLQEPTIKEFLLHTLSKIAIKCNEIAGGTRKKKVKRERTRKRGTRKNVP
jgi:hypothetical protein